jgi:glycosyltransferase involved in cell wall biosynthesis
MNIAIFTNNYLPNPYGVTGSIESFCKEFEKLGHTVYIFAPFVKGYIDNNSNACPPERRVFRYPSIDLNYKISFPLAIPYSKKIAKNLDKLEIDIVHSQHPNLLGWAARKWAKKKNVPLVFTWHTLYDQYSHFAPLVPSKFAAWWTIRNARNYANASDQVVVPTLSVKEIIQKWGVVNENIIAIPTGVDENYYQDADRKKYREKLGILENEKVLLFISRLTAEKNVQFLMKVIIEIVKANKETKAIIAGEGNELEILKDMVKESGVGDRINFLGIIAKDDIKNVYAAGDIFVFASKSETQGMIISEAMYMGLPVVAINAPGIKDMIRNNETGFLVGDNEAEFYNAAVSLIEDTDLRFRFSQNAKKRAGENFTASICAEKLLNVYREAIKRKK